MLSKRVPGLLLACLAWCGSAAAQTGKVYSVLIGVSTYLDADSRRVWLQFANQDAGLFQRYLRERDAQAPLSLLTSDSSRPEHAATRANMLNRLRYILGEAAGERDVVCLFISARGHATRNLDEGFIDAYETQSQKKTTTALTVSDLQRLIRDSPVRRVFLFADVCREGRVGGLDNRINLRLQDLAGAQRKVELILASEPKKASEERKDLQSGVYAHSLVAGMRDLSARGEPVTMLGVFERLMKSVPELTESRQKPHPRPREPGVRLFSSMGFSHGPQLASTAAMWAQTPAADPSRAPRHVDALLAWLGATSPVRLEAGEALIRNLDADRLSDLDRVEIASAVEDVGQMVVAKYGIGDQFPGDPEALERRDFTRAEAAFWAAWRVRPGDLTLVARRLFCRGRALLFEPRTSQDLEEARILFEAAIATDREAVRRTRAPESHESADAHNGLGIVHLERADYTQAARAFREAIRRAPDWSYPRHNLALTLAAAGLGSEAEGEYRAAIARAPYYPYLYYNLGLLLQRENRLRDAEREYRRALPLFEREAAIAEARADIWAKQGRAAQERIARERARRLLLHRAQVSNALAAIREARGDHGGAEQLYRAAAKQDSGFALPEHNLALMQARAGRLNEAVENWRRALARDAKLQPARLALAGALARNGNQSAAVAEYRRLLDAQPEHFEAREGLARTRLAMGDRAGAVRELEIAIADQERQRGARAAEPEIYATLGEWRWDRDEKPAACAAFTKALQASREMRRGKPAASVRGRLQECEAAGLLPRQ